MEITREKLFEIKEYAEKIQNIALYYSHFENHDDIEDWERVFTLTRYIDETIEEVCVKL